MHLITEDEILINDFLFVLILFLLPICYGKLQLTLRQIGTFGCHLSKQIPCEIKRFIVHKQNYF